MLLVQNAIKQIKWWRFTANFDSTARHDKCTLIPKNVPILYPIVTFSYLYEMKTVSVILLQTQKTWSVCKFQMNISDRKKKTMEVYGMACYIVKMEKKTSDLLSQSVNDK